jgi:hypothetical protein
MLSFYSGPLSASIRNRRLAARIARRSLAALVASTLLACAFADRLPGLLSTLEPSSTVAASAVPATVFATPPAVASATGPAPEELHQLQQEVVYLRGLQPTGPLAEAILPSNEIRQRLLEEFLGDYTREQAADEGRLYSLLGLFEGDIDLWTLYRDLYSEQIAGYYDPQVETMYIVAGQGWTGVERLIYVHEFTHTLQDHLFDLEAGLMYSEEACRESGERCRALSALIEGDATLVEEQWLRTFAGPEDIEELLAFSSTIGSPVLDSAPAFLQKDLLFPYEHGLEYIRTLYLRDGWASVDRVYLDPPETTEEILHPGIAPGPTVAVTLGDLAAAQGEGWRELGAGVLGEWHTRLMLEAQLAGDEAETAAAGWGGDAYVALRNDATGNESLALLTVWDRPRDAYEFATAMVRLAQARFGPTTGVPAGSTWTWRDGGIRLERAYTQTLWILAPSAAEAEALRQTVEFPFAP